MDMLLRGEIGTRTWARRPVMGGALWELAFSGGAEAIGPPPSPHGARWGTQDKHRVTPKCSFSIWAGCSVFPWDTSLFPPVLPRREGKRSANTRPHRWGAVLAQGQPLSEVTGATTGRPHAGLLPGTTGKIAGRAQRTRHWDTQLGRGRHPASGRSWGGPGWTWR